MIPEADIGASRDYELVDVRAVLTTKNVAAAWLMLALGANREHAGNDGYDDSASLHYSWDSTVQNHARVAVGDVIALWDRKELVGVSVIEAINTASAEKVLYSCPRCGKADIKRRHREKPAYRCGKCGHLFAAPRQKTKSVTTYRSSHGKRWMNGRGLLSGSELRALCESPKSQLSMRPARWERLRQALLDATGQASTVKDIAAAARLAIAGGHKESLVRTRVGQEVFRARLLREQGEVCAFTGPTPADALEAAHLYSYAESGEHHEYGGLLLRRDIHRLFDLGHIAVDVASGTLDVIPSLHGYPCYAQLHGQPVAVQLRPEHRVWLDAHWLGKRPRA
ncbi:HNH endonuclease [Streptomyces buecherae]|uniref:HNH endonuclease n=1 Tax=Streptomyces buecherae TaxID=2763006 RepID=UPI001E56C390|nr:HNH endonuclease [Streptomyces buecherae]